MEFVGKSIEIQSKNQARALGPYCEPFLSGSEVEWTGGINGIGSMWEVLVIWKCLIGYEKG